MGYEQLTIQSKFIINMFFISEKVQSKFGNLIFKQKKIHVK